MNLAFPILISSLFLFGCETTDVSIGSGSTASPASIKSEIEIVQRYMAASEAQQKNLRGVSMEVDIDARLPRLKKEGRFHALRHISRVGQISYLAQVFTGDNTIKKDVIARYLTAETQAKDTSNSSLAITPANYKFKDKGLIDREGRQVRILQINPRKKRVGLFKGEIWLDPETSLPLREQGRFVKNPSVFLKKVDFVREYDIVDGIAIPKHIDSIVETRVIGKAELRINFSNFRKLENDQVSAQAAATFNQNP